MLRRYAPEFQFATQLPAELDLTDRSFSTTYSYTISAQGERSVFLDNMYFSCYGKTAVGAAFHGFGELDPADGTQMVWDVDVDAKGVIAGAWRERNVRDRSVLQEGSLILTPEDDGQYYGYWTTFEDDGETVRDSGAYMMQPRFES